MHRTAEDYFKLVTPLFVCLAAFLAARLATQMMASYIWTPRGEAARAEATRPSAARPMGLEDYQIIQARNLFNYNPQPAGGTPGDKAAPPPVEAPLPVIDFNLVATAVLSGGNSFAIFAKGDQFLLKHGGDEITPGISLLEIHKEKVVVSLGKIRKELPLFGDRQGSDQAARRTPQRAMAAPAPSAAPGTAGSSENIKQIGANAWAIDKKEVDQAMANLSQLITQIRVVPNLVDGQTQGFKVFSIRPGSLFSQIGLLDGDIIREVNGIQLSGIDVAYQAMSGLQNQTSLQVAVIRGSQPIILSYEIR